MNLKKSLKSIKRKMYGKEKVFITIRTVYTHLSDLSNKEILDYYNVYSLSELEQHIEHIKMVLRDKVENYKEELKELDSCFCMDSRGDFKYLYPSKQEAERQIKFSWETKRVKLKLYPCPFHCGWHLAKV
ncbi:MAG: Unknown protein [uncultured Sulfurovum sp.]|uniref:Uncharacterized protein n=1 Tax=uncultured Sulfurovum sp. TaxID=269237 RepID=A0A6S6SR45_9BACT|nr:MAG: Unknown protein [uncultured Sulfurovum sp.]